MLTSLAGLRLQATAGAANQYSSISGESLLKNYQGPASQRNNPFLKGGDLLNHEMARAYMDGIKDATEGTAWCYRSGAPHELNDDIAAAMAKLPPQQRTGPAGPLVVQVLAQLYPCRKAVHKQK